MPEATPTKLEQKRFVISPESLELMGKAKSTFLELKQEVPYLSGIVFFGSRIRSLERPDSDLDAIIFYDSNKFPDPNGNQDSQILEIKNKISEGLGVELGNHSGWNKNLSLEKTDGDLYTYTKIARSFKNRPREGVARLLSTMPEPQNLFSRFFLGVGDELYKNRKYILDQLAKDTDGDEQFNLLMDALMVFERDNRADRADVPYYSGLPKSIEEARQYFLTEPK